MLCPKCHVDRNQIKLMLEEQPERELYDYGFATRLLESENHAQARHIIENCPEGAGKMKVRQVGIDEHNQTLRRCWHCEHEGNDVNTFLTYVHAGGEGDVPVYVCDDSEICKQRYFQGNQLERL